MLRIHGNVPVVFYTGPITCYATVLGRRVAVEAPVKPEIGFYLTAVSDVAIRSDKADKEIARIVGFWDYKGYLSCLEEGLKSVNEMKADYGFETGSTVCISATVRLEARPFIIKGGEWDDYSGDGTNMYLCSLQTFAELEQWNNEHSFEEARTFPYFGSIEKIAEIRYASSRLDPADNANALRTARIALEGHALEFMKRHGDPKTRGDYDDAGNLVELR